VISEDTMVFRRPEVVGFDIILAQVREMMRLTRDSGGGSRFSGVVSLLGRSVPSWVGYPTTPTSGGDHLPESLGSAKSFTFPFNGRTALHFPPSAAG
jgi:hypothetical protein